MGAFIQVELDTTGPILEESSIPSYIGYGDNTEIELIFGEALSPNHVVEVYDYMGNVKQLTLQIENDTMRGLLDVSGLLGGMAELRVLVFDEVLNPSPIISNNFLILSTDLTAESEIITSKTDISISGSRSVMDIMV